MNVSDSVVRNLHQLLVQIADIKSQIERGPRQVKAAQLQVDSAKDFLQKCRDTIKQKKMEADRKQLQLREREGKIHDWEGKMNSASNNREFQAIKEQIAADTQANNVLSDEILETLEEIDSLQETSKDAETKLKLAEADKAKTDNSVADRLATLARELERVEGNLAAKEKELSPEFMVDYRRLVTDAGGCHGSLGRRVVRRLLHRIDPSHPGQTANGTAVYLPKLWSTPLPT